MPIKTIGVLGAGQMGFGITRIAAQARLNVFLYDEDPNMVFAVIEKLGELGDRVSWAYEDKLFENVDIVIEAITEDREKKAAVFSRLDAFLPEHIIFATNTSTILIRELQESVNRKDKFLGMHFMNPPHVLKLLELVRGPETTDETYDAVVELAHSLERDPIWESPDIYGFAVNGQVMPGVNTAALLLSRMLETGMDWTNACNLVNDTYLACVASGSPIGLLSMADLIGIDTCVYGLRQLAKADKHYKPHPILLKMLKENRLGKKTQIGFFEYTP